ncbi:MAG: methyl-accepting chemotaxis protein [Spirochaetales bacterium]|nr:methyl-accepting chemotaxis protein [Spirochaetales bacterium]
MNIPIKKRLTILSVITITIPLFVLSLIFFIFAGKTIIKESTDRTMEKMLLLDKALTLYMEKIKHTVNTIANNPIIYSLDTRELITYKYNPEWTDMMPLHNSATEKNIYDYLKLININNPDFGAVYVGTASGRFVMYPPSGRRPFYDPSKRPWYNEAKEKNGRTTITSPFQSSDTNFFVFAVAQYVYFINSQEYGVVSANVELSTLTRILSDLNIGNNYVILSTADNIILANTKEPETSFKNLDSSDLPDLFHKLPKIDSGWTEINTGGNIYLASRILSEGTGWYLYTLIDKSEVVAPFRKVFFLMIAISALILTIFTPFAVKFSIDSLVPLKKLSDHLFSVAQGSGNLQKKIPLYSSDEIGTTIENFNLFSESLNNLFIRITEAEQSISSNNSTFSNQMLLASADITKNISSIDNIEKEIHHAETCISNSLKMSEEIEQAAGKNEKSRDFSKYAGIIKMEMEQLASYFKSLSSYVYDIKKTTKDINNCIDTTTAYCKSNKDELIAIGKLLSVYKLKNTETKTPDKSGNHSADRDKKVIK